MIGYLSGQIIGLAIDQCLLLVNGVGYIVALNQKSCTQLSLEQGASFWIEPIMHDGQSHLFGFLSEHEHHWFKILIHVPGVGGRVAQNILSTLPPLELCQAILGKNVDALRRADGVGPKLAQRLMSELQDKARAEAPPLSHNSQDIHEDVTLALSALGYRSSEIKPALIHMDPALVTFEEKMRCCLNFLAKKV